MSTCTMDAREAAPFTSHAIVEPNAKANIKSALSMASSRHARCIPNMKLKSSLSGNAPKPITSSKSESHQFCKLCQFVGGIQATATGINHRFLRILDHLHDYRLRELGIGNRDKYPFNPFGDQYGTLICCCTSFGMSTKTGPGLPLAAKKNASRIILGISSTFITK